MRVDVVTLQRFYASPLGTAAHRQIHRRLDALWPHANGLDMLGVGYATPFLAPYRATARRCVALMPGAQGAEVWPAGAPGLCALGDEARLPFLDAVFDRVILAHALEEATDVRRLVRELWRVMAPEGRIVVIVANRAGLWARADGTPFGHGRPFSRGQLAELLRDGMFEPTASARAAFVPPLPWTPLLALADGFETAGRLIAPGVGGVLLMEAVKRLTAQPRAHRAVVRVQAAKPASAAATYLPDARERVQIAGRPSGFPR